MEITPFWAQKLWKTFPSLGTNIGKFLAWAVAERMHGITMKPRVEQCKEALAGKQKIRG